MGAILEKIHKVDDLEKKTALLFSELKPQMEHIRRHVDALEASVPDNLWSLPKYREMLFIK
jgi:glutamine synthetase